MNERASGSAFGLALRCDPALLGTALPAPPDAPTVDVRTGEVETSSAQPIHGGDPLTVAVTPDGATVFEQPFYGAARLDPGAVNIVCQPRPGPAWRWERFLMAQALPAAALAHGRQPIHASGVVAAERAVLVLGVSGAGKSTTALGLVRAGARFLSDDVVALETRGGEVVAHHGPAVSSAAAGAPSVPGARVVGTLDGEDRLLVPDPCAGPVPVGVVALVVRDEATREVEVSEEADWTAILLGSHFSPLLAERAGAQLAWLETCERLAAQAQTVLVRAPLEGAPDGVIDALAEVAGL